LVKRFSAAVFFLVLSAALTFPLVFNAGRYIPGFFSTNEPYDVLWNYWVVKFLAVNNLSQNSTDLIAYPFGAQLLPSGLLITPLIAVSRLLCLVIPYVAFWNIQIFLNLILSAFFTYLILFHMTKDQIASCFGAICFAFCPYQFARIWQHLGLTFNEWITFLLYTAILYREKQDKTRGVLFLAGLLLVFSFDYTITYLGIVSLFVFFMFMFGEYIHGLINLKYRPRDYPSYLKGTVLICFLALIILLPYIIPVVRNFLVFGKTLASPFNLYHRPFEDLFSQSAKPLSYILPSPFHPLFGRFTERFVDTILYGKSLTEHILFLGWTTIFLAFIAVKNWARKRGRYEGFFILLLVVSWLFSQPPWWNIFGFKVYMPSFLMYKLLPMYRAYCRFGIVVMLAVSVLAGFGLKIILNRQSNGSRRAFLAVLFFVLVLFEFWNWPPFRVIDVSKAPKAYYWIRELPDNTVIAEYPLDADSPNEMYKFYQITHNKKMVNGSVPGTPANDFAKSITRLSDSKTARELSKIGVSYAVVHRDGYERTELMEMIEEYKAIPGNPYLKLVKSFPEQKCPDDGMLCTEKTGQIDVYRIALEGAAYEKKN
jgi:hypothetical protein